MPLCLIFHLQKRISLLASKVEMPVKRRDKEYGCWQRNEYHLAMNYFTKFLMIYARLAGH